jgi:hypothetical protein
MTRLKPASSRQPRQRSEGDHPRKNYVKEGTRRTRASPYGRPPSVRYFRSALGNADGRMLCLPGSSLSMNGPTTPEC